MQRLWARWRSGDRRGGQIIVEFAMVAPIFFFLTLGLIDAARYVYIRGVLTARVEAAARELTSTTNLGSDCTVMASMVSKSNAINVDADPMSVASDTPVTQASPYAGTQPPAGSGYAYIYPAVASSTPTTAACTWSVTPPGFTANSSTSMLRNASTGSVSAQIRYRFQPWTPVIGTIDIVVTATLLNENFGASRDLRGIHYMAAAANGTAGASVWFTEYAANKIGRLDLTTDRISEYDIATPDSGPWYILPISSSFPFMYFTEERGDQIGRICWEVDVVHNCSQIGQFLPALGTAQGLSPNAGPRRLEEEFSSPYGMWFTEYASGKIGFIDCGTVAACSSTSSPGTIYEASACSSGTSCQPDYIEVNPKLQSNPENYVVTLHGENALVGAYFATSTLAVQVPWRISFNGVCPGCHPSGSDHDGSLNYRVAVAETTPAGGAGVVSLQCGSLIAPNCTLGTFAQCPNPSSAPEDLQSDTSDPSGDFWMVEPDANIIQHVNITANGTGGVAACYTVGGLENYYYQMPTAGAGPFGISHGANNRDIWVTESRAPSRGLVDFSPMGDRGTSSTPVEYLVSPW